MSAPGRHPHFMSPQLWFRSLDDALAAAKAGNKSVLVQVGRQSCGGCRNMVEKVVAKEEIREFLDGHYVCLAADADAPEPAVAALLDQVPVKERTPFCLYVGAEGRLLHATTGGRPAAVFLTDLIEAVARRQAPPAR
jgi:hypothetical protein